MFAKFTEELTTIADLPDKPLDGVDGLSPDELKAKFDEDPNKLKDFINDWIDAIAAGTAASNIGAKTSGGQNTTLQAVLDTLLTRTDGDVSVEYNDTLTTSDWRASEGDVAPYTQEVTISGVLATDSPIIDLVASETYSTAVAEDEAWSKIYKAVAGLGTITFYAKEEPTVALTFKARCIRK